MLTISSELRWSKNQLRQRQHPHCIGTDPAGRAGKELVESEMDEGVGVGPGGGGTPLYGLYRYVRPQRVGFFSRLSHK